MLSVGFALLAAMSFQLAAINASGAFLFVAAACIQLRLLCNLMDGMMAIEHGLSSHTGALFNEIPDRVSDCLILIAAGWAVALPGSVHLAYAAALFAVATAYLRLLGGSLGQAQSFDGPMAKQRRMDVLTLCALIDGFWCWFIPTLNNMPVLYLGLWVVMLGSVVTCVRRIQMIESKLQPGQQEDHI